MIAENSTSGQGLKQETAGSNSFWEDETGISLEDAGEYYSFFADVFLTPIPATGKERLKQLQEATEEFFPYQEQQPENDESLPGVALMNAFFKEAAADPEAFQEQLARDRACLFSGVDGQELLPPYASNWSGEDGAVRLSKVQAYYALVPEFSVAKDTGERDDYIGVEFAFLARLLSREGVMRLVGDGTSADSFRGTRKDFLLENVNPWFPAYCEQAVVHAKTDYFKGLLQAIPSLIL